MKNIEVGLHNKFEIVVTDAKTGKVKRTAKAENIILNKLWNSYFMDYRKFNYIHFGSGSTTPVATDTSLTTLIAGRACTTDSIDTSTFFTDGIIKRKRSIRIEDTEYVGSIISEVGFAQSTSSSDLCTKALVKDANGNTLSIEKHSGEIIDIYGTIYAKVPIALAKGDDVSFDGTTGSYTFLGILIGNAQSTSLQAYFALGKTFPKAIPYGAAIDGKYSGSTSTPTWSSANKKLTFVPSNLTASIANIGGIDLLSIGGLNLKLPRTGFTMPALTKEVIATGDGTTKDFSCAFGKILDNSTAKLYVNDVEVSATFDYGVPNFTASSTKAINSFLEYITDPVSFRAEAIFENVYRGRISIATVWATNLGLYASNDLTNWTLIGSRVSSGSISVSSTYKDYRYWKVIPKDTTTNWVIASIYTTGTADNKQIHATTAPASGTTVALTYQPDLIAKDANHVVNNMLVEIVFNEYTP